MIEICVESAFATVCVQSAIAGCFLLFWWGWLGRVVLHQVTWLKKLNNKLKVVISLLSKANSESGSFTVLFYGNPLNSARGCIQTAVTAAVFTENVRMSRRWKAESVVYGICKQLSPRFVHLLPWDLIVHRSVQSVQKVFSTLFVCVCAFSLHRKSPDMILGDKPLISELDLSLNNITKYEVILIGLHKLKRHWSPDMYTTHRFKGCLYPDRKEVYCERASP
jgi:hypothetical protein